MSKRPAELQAVVELEPKDQLSAQLLKGLTTPPGRTRQGVTAAPCEAGRMAEVWLETGTGSRPDGSKFELNLTEDNRFSWNSASRTKRSTFQAPTRWRGQLLDSDCTAIRTPAWDKCLAPGDKLQFKLARGSPSDPGLTFTR